MSYLQYGIDQELVERVKLKMKDKQKKERIKKLLDGVTKADLQNRTKVAKLLNQATKVLGEKISSTEASRIIDFIIAQKIDPNNTLHLLKLWSMFR